MQAGSEALTAEALRRRQKQIPTGLFGYISKQAPKKQLLREQRHGHLIVKPNLLIFELLAGHNPKKRHPCPGLLPYSENNG